MRSRGRLPVGLGSSNKSPVPVSFLFSPSAEDVPLNQEERCTKGSKRPGGHCHERRKFCATASVSIPGYHRAPEEADQKLNSKPIAISLRVKSLAVTGH